MTTSDSPKRDRQRRALLCLAVVLLIGALSTWTLALVAATTPLPPLVLVFAPHPAPPNAPVPIRVVAFDAGARKRVDVDGVVVIAGARHRLENGHAMLAPQPPGPVDLVIEGNAGGRSIVHPLSLLVGQSGSKQSLAFERWTEEVADTRSPVLLPETKSVSTNVNTALVVGETPPRVVTLKPNVIGAKAPDGRALRLDRRPFVLRLPPFVSKDAATVEVVVESSRKLALYLDLYRGDKLAAFERVEVNSGTTRVQLELPPGGRAKAWTVAAAESPIGRQSAAFATTVVAPSLDDASAMMAETIANVAPDAKAELALVRSAKTAAPDVAATILRAAASRLLISPAQPDLVGPSKSAQVKAAAQARAADVRQWRLPFRAFTGAFAALALGFALVPAVRSRREHQRQEELVTLEDDVEIEAETRLSRLRRQAVAGAALVVAAGVLWVLDWSLGFVAK